MHQRQMIIVPKVCQIMNMKWILSKVQALQTKHYLIIYLVSIKMDKIYLVSIKMDKIYLVSIKMDMTDKGIIYLVKIRQDITNMAKINMEKIEI